MRRRGFSLTEILIAIVLIGIVGAGITRLLQSQMRFFQRSTNARDARSVSRNAVNIMRNEMRMIEPGGILAATPESVTVLVPYRMGILCSASTGTFVPMDSLQRAAARFAGYGWRATASTGGWTYVTSNTAPISGLPASCTGISMSPIPNGELLTLTPALAAVAGTPLMLFQRVTYRFGTSTLVPGRTALWRVVAGGVTEEVAVPFAATSRFRFFIGGGTAAQDAAPGVLSTMSGVELELVGQSTRNSPGTGTPESNATRVAIFFRNAVN